MSRRLRAHGPFLALLVLFLALGVLYNVTTPIFEAPDEIWHFAHIRYVAQRNALPVQGARQGEEAAHQEASQPPLYYVLAATLVRAIDTSDVDAYVRLNPHAAPGLPHSDGNKNMVIPLPAPFPWHGTALAVHSVRAFSLLLGLITVLCAYLMARRLWAPTTGGSSRGDRLMPVIVAGLVAFNPQFLFISNAINNDNMMTATASVTLLMVIGLAVRGGLPSYRQIIVLGLLGGLAALSKLTGVGLLGFVAVALVAICLRQHPAPAWRACLARLAVFGLVAALVAGWWYVRNWLLYADVTGLQPMLVWVGQRHLSWAGLLEEVDSLELSFWAVFGWFNILVDNWIYLALRVIVRLAMVGLVALLARWLLARRQRWQGLAAGLPNPLLLGLVALWSAIVLAGLARWTATTPGSQGRLLFPAITALAALLASGLAALLPRRWRAPALGGLAAALFVLAAISPLHYIAPTYAAPASLPSTPSSMQRQAHLRYGDDELELLGYAIDRQTALPGDTIEITLYVEALQRMTTDYSMFIHLWGADMEWLGARDSFLGRGAWPTSQMSAGQIIEDRYAVSIAPTATVPSRIRMEIGFYELESGRRLWATSPDGTRSELPFVGRIKLASPRPGDRTPLPSILSFEDKLSLVSATAQTPPAIQAGSTITVSTTWQAKNTMAEDYTIFMQVVDAGLTIVAQRDIQPRAGDYPTSYWEAGEVVTDQRTLELPATLPAGRYRIVTGIYLLSTGERLPASSAAGPADENWAVISEFSIP